MKSHLLLSGGEEAALEIGGEGLEVWSLTRPSPEHPERNEDAAGVWIYPDGSIVLAVADGMGGTPAGQLAAQTTIRRLDKTLRAGEGDASRRRLILDAIEKANEDVLASAPGSGTTLVVSEFADSLVRTYNVGDSGALLVGQRGRVKMETTAHSPVGYGIAAGLIDAESALAHRDRHYLSNHVGSREMHIDVGSPQTWGARDTLLLASDGLFDNVGPAEIVETIRCGALGGCVENLDESVRASMGEPGAEQRKGKPDDLTVLLARRRPGR